MRPGKWNLSKFADNGVYEEAEGLAWLKIAWHNEESLVPATIVLVSFLLVDVHLGQVSFNPICFQIKC